ncbi:MAG: HNH endonuclease [Dehalococcoidia bacterium]|nr:HNH endonuclease [Dehalococcoidia bacterium]
MQDIKDHLSYDQGTGTITWSKPPNTNNRIKAGSIAGTTTSEGYIRIKYKGKNYQAHRLAWYFHYDEVPAYPLDHINEIKDDNRIVNLRLDTNGANTQNISTPQVNNASGFLGVSWCKPNKKWRAQIKVKGKKINLGSYDTPEEARDVYLCAKREYHPFWVEA